MKNLILLFQLILILLKLLGFINYSWFWVLFPMIFGLSVYLLIGILIILTLIIVFIGTLLYKIFFNE